MKTQRVPASHADAARDSGGERSLGDGLVKRKGIAKTLQCNVMHVAQHTVYERPYQDGTEETSAPPADGRSVWPWLARRRKSKGPMTLHNVYI